MKNKLILFVLIIFSVVALANITILSVMQSNVKLNLPTPNKIIVYKNSQISSKTLYEGEKDFETIIKLYNYMSQKTLLQQLTSGKIINNNVLVGTHASTWSETNKENGYWLEFVFDNAKKMIITSSGNTRRIDVKGIIFNVSNIDAYTNTMFFYRETDIFSQKDQYFEEIYPIIIEANTKEIFNLLKEM